MNYIIRARRTGELTLRGDCAFDGGNPAEAVPYAMFVWIVEGGPAPILVDTGPRSIAEINHGLGDMCIEPVTRRPGEDLLGILDSVGVRPREVSHVFLTHLHYDHVSNLHLFPNARIVVDSHGYREALLRLEKGLCWVPGEVIYPMRDQWQDRLILAEDGEILRGIRITHFGGHTPCSMGVSVRTAAGVVLIAGDVVSLYDNIERNIPIGVFEDRGEVMAAMARIRKEADIILPSHDPLVLHRYANGVIG